MSKQHLALERIKAFLESQGFDNDKYYYIVSDIQYNSCKIRVQINHISFILHVTGPLNVILYYAKSFLDSPHDQHVYVKISNLFKLIKELKKSFEKISCLRNILGKVGKIPTIMWISTFDYFGKDKFSVRYLTADFNIYYDSRLVNKKYAINDIDNKIDEIELFFKVAQFMDTKDTILKILEKNKKASYVKIIDKIDFELRGITSSKVFSI